METNTNQTARSRDNALNALIDDIKDEKIKHYIRTRVLDQMRYYSRAGAKNKRLYERWTWAYFIMSAMIPVIITLTGSEMTVFLKGFIAILAVGGIISNTVSDKFQYKELWMSYRSTREALLRVLYDYFYHVGQFSKDIPQEENDSLLVNACEAIMANENIGWFDNMYKSHKHQEKKQSA